MDEFARQRIAHLEQKIARLEKKLDFVLGHLRLDYPDEVTQHVRALLAAGRKQDAIAYLHRERGLKLAEAAAQVEQIARG